MYIYMLICKLFLGEGRVKTMKIDIEERTQKKRVGIHSGIAEAMEKY